MYQLRNKTILILSPQSWGTMFLSKHHYALELAKLDNTVFFLNPPSQDGNKQTIQIEKSDVNGNLFFINHKLKFPYELKFHAQKLFHWLIRFHLKRVLKKIKQPVDIVWSFDLGNTYPLSFFHKAVKIFHPVDEPLNKMAIDAAKGCDIIFSVTNEILDKYKVINAPRHFINHGVSDYFLAEAIMQPVGRKIRVGISGNFTRPDIDRDILLQIIDENPEVIFECWGSYEANQSNLGGSNDALLTKFIQSLQSKANVALHGPLSSGKLATELKRMDAFLICYDILKDQSGGTNYHKILEYLSTGKVVISNSVTTYQHEEGLLEMTTNRNNNNELPALFKKVINNLNSFNNIVKQKKRIAYAIDNTYARQLSRIEKKLKELMFHE